MKRFYTRCLMLTSLGLLLSVWSAAGRAGSPYCDIADGKFKTNCPELPLPTGTQEEELRAQECRQLAQEIAGQSGMGSFGAQMKKDDLQKIHTRRCSRQLSGLSDNSPECQRIASDLRGLVGAQVQSSLVRKSDLLRLYDSTCGMPTNNKPRPAIVITR